MVPPDPLFDPRGRVALFAFAARSLADPAFSLAMDVTVSRQEATIR